MKKCRIRLQFDFRLISKDNEKVFSRTGRVFLSKKFKVFENKIKLTALSQYRDEPLEGDLKLVIRAGYTNKRHSDCCNLFKSCADALQKICYHNDRQIKHAECIVFENELRDYFLVDIKKCVFL